MADTEMAPRGTAESPALPPARLPQVTWNKPADIDRCVDRSGDSSGNEGTASIVLCTSAPNYKERPKRTTRGFGRMDLSPYTTPQKNVQRRPEVQPRIGGVAAAEHVNMTPRTSTYLATQHRWKRDCAYQLVRYDADINCHNIRPGTMPRGTSMILNSLNGGGSVHNAAETLAGMDPEDAATAIAAINPQESAGTFTILAGRDLEGAAKIFENMDPSAAASIMMEMQPDKAAAVLNQMQADKAAAVLLEMPAEKAAELLGLMDPDKAGAVLLEMPTEKAVGLLNIMDADKAGAILSTMDVAQAANLVSAMEPDKIGAVLDSMEPDKVGGILLAMSPQKAAGALEKMDSSQAGKALLSMTPEQSAAMLGSMDARAAGEVMATLDPQHASAMLSSIDDVAVAGTILSNIAPEKAALLVLNLDHEQALGLIAAAADCDPTSAGQMLLAMHPTQALPFFMQLAVGQAAAVLNEMGVQESAKLCQFAISTYKGKTSSGTKAKTHVGHIVAAMLVAVASQMLGFMEASDVAAILIAFPKGLGQWEKHPSIPEDQIVGVSPLRWLQTQGAAARLLLNMETVAAIAVVAQCENLERGRVHEMLNECSSCDVATKLDEMEPHQIMGFIQFSHFSDQVKFISKMEPCNAGRFLMDRYRKEKTLDRILALEDHDREVVINAMAKRAKTRGQGALSEWTAYEYAVRQEEGVRRKALMM